jgi:diacylglycerol kinase (ATP)
MSEQPTEPYCVEDNPHKGNRGLTRALLAARHSWSGLKFAWAEESAFRQELTLAAILLPLACVIPLSPIERVALIGVVLLVLIVELLNSSVEAAIDRISFDKHGLSKRAKDFGSAAVMLSLFLCVVTWAIILAPRVL